MFKNIIGAVVSTAKSKPDASLQNGFEAWTKQRSPLYARGWIRECNSYARIKASK